MSQLVVECLHENWVARTVCTVNGNLNSTDKAESGLINIFNSGNILFGSLSIIKKH